MHKNTSMIMIMMHMIMPSRQLQDTISY